MKTQEASVAPVAPVAANYPKKIFYRIKEVAEITGIQPYVLRYWESEFSELAPEKDASDQRRYRQKDIQTILAIRKLLYEERYTIQGARRQLKHRLRNGGGYEAQTAVEEPIEPAREVADDEPPGEGLAAAHAADLYKSALREGFGQLRREMADLLRMLDG